MTISREQAAQAALNEALADAYAVGLRGRVTARNGDEQQLCRVVLMQPVALTALRSGGVA